MVKGVRFVTNLPRLTLTLLVWVCFVVDILQLIDGVVGVVLCGLQRRVTHQLLYIPHICTTAKQVSSKGMAQNVGRGLALNTILCKGALHRAFNLPAAHSFTFAC